MERIKSMYVERPSLNLEQKIDELRDLESGSAAKYELADAERAELLAIDAELAEQLERMYELITSSLTIDLEYLQTEVGRSDFETTFGTTFPKSENRDAVELHLLANSELLRSIDPAARDDFAGRSKSHTEAQVHADAFAGMNDNGVLNTANIKPPHPIQLPMRIENVVAKIDGYRALKQDIKKRLSYARDDDSSLGIATRDLLTLYQRRINELLADTLLTGRSLIRKNELELNLTDDEAALHERLFHLDDQDKVASRYDKFIHGTEGEPNESGFRPQIGEELRTYADEQARAYHESIVNREAYLQQSGLDRSALTDSSRYDPESVRRYAQEVLEAYDLLSNEPPETYNPEREGPPADGKWQVIIKDAYSNPSVDGKQHVVKLPLKSQSAMKLFPVTLAHEIEGHVLQNDNRESINLKLFERVGADRQSIFAEGGAKWNQDHVTELAFGIPVTPHPHYIRAMLRKLEGGTYADCVAAHFESSIAPYQTLRDTHELTQEDFRKRCQSLLKNSVRNTRRLFRNEADPESINGHLTSSKDSVYLEQLRLQEQLKAADLERYLYLNRVNLDALIFLQKAGLLDQQAIRAPEFVSLKIWERERDVFVSLHT